MGIERFFNSLVKNKHIEQDGIIVGLEDKIIANYLYIDFNSIIYNIISILENELNYLLYSIILHEKNNDEFDDKTIMIAQKWSLELTNISINEYKKYFTNELIETISIERLKDYIKHLTKNIINPDELELIYIAIDGIPQMGKIIEQKKRRYNGYVISQLSKKIYEKYYDNMPEERKIYENNKLSFDRGKIISYTNFMKQITDILSTNEFKMELKQQNKNLVEVVISHQNIIGEGERKIIDHILQNNKSGKYVIYSPDADVIILGITTLNKLNSLQKVIHDKSDNNITILRFNMRNYLIQKHEYDTVNINMLCNNIYSYITTELQNNDYTKENVTNDIAFIFTLFGNDFIPKLESIDVRNDIETLMSLYCTCMKKARKPYLTFIHHDSYKINYINFTNFINLMANIENTLLLDTYMSHKYKNYGYYKKQLNEERLYPVLKVYFEKANDVFFHLRNIIKRTERTDNSSETNETNETEETNINETNIDEMNKINEIVEKYRDDIKFIEQFLILEKFKYIKNENENKETDKSDKSEETIINKSIEDKFRDHLINMIKNTDIENPYIGGRMKFYLYDTTDVNTYFHMKNIKNNLIHSKMEITDFDKEVYKLENKIGEYEIKLNGSDLDLGSINIHIKSNGDYAFYPINPFGNIIDYYDTFFNITHQYSFVREDRYKPKIIFNDKLDDIIIDYIKGLFWVFDNYFNKNKTEYNSKYISTWVYNYHRVPLIYQVKDFLIRLRKQNNNTDYINFMNKLYYEVSKDEKYIIDRMNYMNSLEHYLYVTPMNRHRDIPDKYIDMIKNNTDIFTDLNITVNDLWSNKNTKQIIDCRRIPYLNKCNLLSIKTVKYNEYMKLMYMYRNKTDIPLITKPIIFEYDNIVGGFIRK